MVKNYQAHEPCIICQTDEVQRCYHHLMTRKTYPEFKDADFNKCPCCQRCHNMFHNKGTNYMATYFPLFRQWLLDHGWAFDAYQKKWRHYQKITFTP